MNKTSAILIAFTLLGAGLVFTPAALAVHGPATPQPADCPATDVNDCHVRFVFADDLDTFYPHDTTPPGAVKGVGTVLGLELQSGVVTGSPATVQVRVTSESDAAGEIVTLTRTVDGAPASYFGFVGLESTLVSSNGRVFVNDEDTLVAAYEAPSPDLVSQTIIFESAVTGTLATDATIYFGAGAGGGATSAVITLTDADENTASGSAQTVDVRVRSTADLSAQTLITLTETGVNTGIFEGEVFFASSAPDADSILVDHGATVSILYDDQANAKGNEVTTTKTVTWFEAGTGAVFFTDSLFRDPLDGDTDSDITDDPCEGACHAYSGHGKAYLRVNDDDKDLTGSVDTVTVQVGSDDQPAPTILTLTETGPRTGEFQGSIDLVSALTAGKLLVSDTIGDADEEIWARYDDNVGVSGSDPAPDFAQALWSAGTTAVLRFSSCDVSTDATDFYGDDLGATVAPCGVGSFQPGSAFGRGHIVVEDDDQDTTGGTDTLQVTVKSSMDPSGLAENPDTASSVTLTETGATTGIFYGFIDFYTNLLPADSGNAQPDALWVVDGATLTVSYADVTEAGAEATVTDTATWHQSDSATLTLDRAAYFGATSTVAIGPAATVTVVDTDRDTNKNSADTLTVHVSSTADGDGFDLTLTEVKKNAGVFRGSFGFKTSGASDATNKLIRVADGNTVSVTYDEAFARDGSDPASTAVSDTATWSAPTAAGTILFDSDTLFGTSGTVTVFLVDASPDDGGDGKVTVEVTSSVDGVPEFNGIKVDLTETASGNDVYKGTFTLSSTTTSDSTDTLRVADGGRVTVTCRAAGPGDDCIALVDEAFTWRQTADPILSVIAGDNDVSPGDFCFLVDGGDCDGSFQYVTSGSADDAEAVSGAFAILRVDRSPAGLGSEDDLYSDPDADGEVSTGDFRFTATPGGASGSTVDCTAPTIDDDCSDTTTAVAVLRIDRGTLGATADDDFYADLDTDGDVSDGDFRFTDFTPALLAGTTTDCDGTLPDDADCGDAVDVLRVDNGVAGATTDDDLYHDADDSGTLNEDDFRFTDFSATLLAGTQLDCTAPDEGAAGFDGDCAAGTSGAVAIVRVDQGTLGATADDDLYGDVDTDGDVSDGDFRFMSVGTFAAGSAVACPSDSDCGDIVSVLRIDQGTAGETTDDDLYADHDDSGTVTRGDFRFTAVGSFAAGTTLACTGPAESNNADCSDVEPAAPLLRTDNGGAGASVDDGVYGDLDADGGISPGDFCFPTIPATATCGPIVAVGDPMPAVSTAFEILRFDGGATGVDPSDDLYGDTDESQTISAGDFCYTSGTCTGGGGTTVAGGDPDEGLRVDTSVEILRVDEGAAGQTVTDDLYADLSSVLATHKMFGVNDPLRLLVVDPDQNRDSDVVDVFEANVVTGSVTEAVALVETAPDSGAFWRAVPFESTAVANNARVGPVTGGSVTLSNVDDRPTTGSTATFTDVLGAWYPTGSLTFSLTSGGAAITSITGFRTLHVQVTDYYEGITDPGLGSSGLQDTRTLEFTAVETEGVPPTVLDGPVTVTLTETTVSSNIFRGSITLDDVTGATKLDVDDVGVACDTTGLPAATVHARLGGNSGAGPASPAGEWVTGSLPWSGRQTADVDFQEVTGVNPLILGDIAPGFVYEGLTTGYLEVDDCDANASASAADTVSVTLTSTSDGTGISVTLTETGANTGKFRGTFGFTTGTSDNVNDKIKVATGDLLTAVYTDAANEDGNALAITSSNSPEWLQTFTGTVALDQPKYLEPDTGTVVAADKDADTSAVPDGLTVTVDSFTLADYEADDFSTPYDTIAAFALTETGATSGVFRNPGLTMEGDAAPAADGVIEFPLVGGYFRVTYDDSKNAAGEDPDGVFDEGFWYPTDATEETAYITVECNASCLLDDGTQCTSSCVADTFLRSTSTGTIRVVDRDSEFATNTADSVKAWAFSNSDGVGAQITLTETGLNTHVFTGTLGFEAAYAAGNSLVFANNNDVVTVVYAESEPASPAILTTDTDTAMFLTSSPPVASLSFTAAGLAVTFTMSATDDGSIVSWRLDPDGDGDFDHTGTDNLRTASRQQAFTYPAAGTYSALLSVTDDTGNTATTSVSVTVSVPVVDTTPPAAPTNLIAGTNSTTTLAFSWTAPGDDGTTGTVAGYLIKVSATSFTAFAETTDTLPAGVTVTYGTLVAGGGAQAALLEGLEPNTTYFIALKARDEVPNVGVASAVLSATTLEGEVADVTAPGAVTGLEAVGPTETDVGLSWIAPGDDDATGTVAGYLVKVDDEPFTAFPETENVRPLGVLMVLPSTLAGPGLVQTAFLSGLQEGTTYYVAVKAIDDAVPTANAGLASSVVEFTTLETLPPPPLVDEEDLQDANEEVADSLEVERDGDDILLSWDEPDGPLPVLGYQVWMVDEDGNVIYLGETSDTEFTVEDAPEGASYFVTAYFGFSEDLGYIEAEVGEEADDLPAYVDPEELAIEEAPAQVDGDEKDGFPWWGWLLIGLGVLLVVGLIVLLVVLSRRKAAAEEAQWDAGAQEGWSEEGGEASSAEAAADASPPDTAEAPAPAPAAPADIHQVTCPRCSTDFTAHGQKPLMIECPNCHVRGMLR